MKINVNIQLEDGEGLNLEALRNLIIGPEPERGSAPAPTAEQVAREEAARIMASEEARRMREVSTTAPKPDPTAIKQAAEQIIATEADPSDAAQVKAVVEQYYNTKGMIAFKNKLKALGVKRVTELAADKLPGFLGELRAEMGAA